MENKLMIIILFIFCMIILYNTENHQNPSMSKGMRAVINCVISAFISILLSAIISFGDREIQNTTAATSAHIETTAAKSNDIEVPYPKTSVPHETDPSSDPSPSIKESAVRPPEFTQPEPSAIADTTAEIATTDSGTPAPEVAPPAPSIADPVPETAGISPTFPTTSPTSAPVPESASDKKSIYQLTPSKIYNRSKYIHIEQCNYETPLKITSCETYDNGFILEYRSIFDDEQYLYDGYEGIFGNFQYTRELSLREIQDFMHSGILTDESGDSCEGAEFFSALTDFSSGIFGLNLTEDLSPGTYFYTLKHNIGDDIFSAKFKLIIYKKDLTDEPDESTENIPEDNISNLEIVNVKSSRLEIVDAEVFDSPYRYTYTIDGEPNYFSEMDYGIRGTFEYTTPLTKVEEKTWGHGGKILNSSGQDCPGGIFFSIFLSNQHGVFMMQYPNNLTPGDYTFILYHYIDDVYNEARIQFTID